MNVIKYLKTSQAQNQCSMAVKMDMSKTYDCVEWEFVSQVMQRLGFHEKCFSIKWIMQCIIYVSYPYLINDSVYGVGLGIRITGSELDRVFQISDISELEKLVPVG